MACHNDGDKNNNCAANLRWDTAVNNERDKAAHGTKLNGTRNHKSRLTEADIIAIRLLLAQGEKQLSIAETFGVSYKTISKIKLRQRWGWLAA
jgi:DNA invertase Pin-like site-specific DNA recombinase